MHELMRFESYTFFFLFNPGVAVFLVEGQGQKEDHKTEMKVVGVGGGMTHTAIM